MSYCYKRNTAPTMTDTTHTHTNTISCSYREVMCGCPLPVGGTIATQNILLSASLMIPVTMAGSTTNTNYTHVLTHTHTNTPAVHM